MINYIEIQDDLKNLTDDHVKRIVMAPANPMHATLAVAELDRRNRMRTDQQARMANPMTTIADQLVTGAPNGPAPMAPAGPAAPSPTGQAPVGLPMQHGGAVPELSGLAALMRSPEFETLEGALGRARTLSGGNLYSDALRRMIDEYRAGEANRRNMDRTQLLLGIGSGLMNSRRPDYLGALGEGAERAVSGLEGLVQRRNTEARQGIQDEAALARIAQEEQNRELGTAMQLFGLGRTGLQGAADIEEGILNRQTQRDVANIYASRAGGAGGAGGSTIELRAMFNRASINLNSARNQLAQMRRQGLQDEDPAVMAQVQLIRRLEQEYNQAQQALVDAISGDGTAAGGLDSVYVPEADPFVDVAPLTNAPATRPGAGRAPGASGSPGLSELQRRAVIEQAGRQRGIRGMGDYQQQYRQRDPNANTYDNWTIRR